MQEQDHAVGDRHALVPPRLGPQSKVIQGRHVGGRQLPARVGDAGVVASLGDPVPLVPVPHVVGDVLGAGVEQRVDGVTDEVPAVRVAALVATVDGFPTSRVRDKVLEPIVRQPAMGADPAHSLELGQRGLLVQGALLGCVVTKVVDAGHDLLQGLDRQD